MVMQFEELDTTTRGFMVAEFDAEQSSDLPYVSKNLSGAGQAAFVEIVRQALLDGDEVVIAEALQVENYWEPLEHYTTKTGKPATRRINIRQKSETLALNEFSTWYAAGFLVPSAERRRR